MTELGRSLIKEGKQENSIQIAKRAIKEGMSDELISKLTDINYWTDSNNKKNYWN